MSDLHEHEHDMLRRASLDHCVKCTICETQCPVAAVTPLFSGPKYVGPQAERFRNGDLDVLVATTVTHASHRPTAESTKRKSRTIATAPTMAAQVVPTTSKDWPVTAMSARVESGKTG